MPSADVRVSLDSSLSTRLSSLLFHVQGPSLAMVSIVLLYMLVSMNLTLMDKWLISGEARSAQHARAPCPDVDLVSARVGLSPGGLTACVCISHTASCLAWVCACAVFSCLLAWCLLVLVMEDRRSSQRAPRGADVMAAHSLVYQWRLRR